MKSYQKKERSLSKKITELETRLNVQGTSSFGTGQLLSNIEPEEMEELRRAAQPKAKNNEQELQRRNSIPSDVTMQSIDSLEELIVTNPTQQSPRLDASKLTHSQSFTLQDNYNDTEVATEGQKRQTNGMIRPIPKPQTFVLQTEKNQTSLNAQILRSQAPGPRQRNPSEGPCGSTQSASWQSNNYKTAPP